MHTAGSSSVRCPLDLLPRAALQLIGIAVEFPEVPIPEVDLFLQSVTFSVGGGSPHIDW